jgi:hypothetical protein
MSDNSSIRVRSTKGKFVQLEHELHDYLPKIGSNAYVLYSILERFSNHETGLCFPKISTIAAMMGVSRPTVHSALKSLIDCALIEFKSGAENGKANEYVLVPVGCKNSLQGCKDILQGCKNSLHPNKEELEPFNYNQLTLTSPSAPSDGINKKTSDLDIGKLFEYFCQSSGKSKTYMLTPKRQKMAEARWKECLKISEGNVDNAKVLIQNAIEGLVQNKFMQEKGLLEWEQIFRSQDNFSKWLDRYENEAK